MVGKPRSVSVRTLGGRPLLLGLPGTALTALTAVPLRCSVLANVARLQWRRRSSASISEAGPPPGPRRGATGEPLGVEIAAAARGQGDAGLGLEPGSDACGGPVRQQLYHAMPRGVGEDRERACQPGTGGPTGGEAEPSQCLGALQRLACRVSDQCRQAFGKDAAPGGRIRINPREIRGSAQVTAARSGSTRATGTRTAASHSPTLSRRRWRCIWNACATRGRPTCSNRSGRSATASGA